MADKELMEIAFSQPKLVDDELARQLAERAAREGTWHRNRLFAVCLSVGLLLGFVIALFGLSSFQVFSFIGLIGLVGCLIGTIKERRVTQALLKRQYDKVNLLAHDAIFWNTLWLPFTAWQFNASSRSYITLLLMEGRYTEFEILTRYAWAFNECKPIADGTPKLWLIANNLAVSYLLQWRFAEAAELLRAFLPSTKKKQARLYLLNNLALCTIKMEQAEETEKYLKEAFELNGKKSNSPIGLRLLFINALLQSHLGKFEEAEESLTSAQQLGIKRGEPVEFQAECNAALAEMRVKQERLDEAELYYRNAIDILESAPNPPYYTLSRFLYSYADVQRTRGNEEGSEKSIKRADMFKAINEQRDIMAIEGVKERLASRKHILVGTQLLQNEIRFPVVLHDVLIEAFDLGKKSLTDETPIETTESEESESR